jgi:hypothetical protein
MDTSIFLNKDKKPSETDLKKALGNNYETWVSIKDYVFKNCTGTFEEWNFSKYGWNYRIKDKKRAIIYMMPFENFFRVSFVLGEKASTEAMNSNLTTDTKKIISSAKVYAEGRGVIMYVKNKTDFNDVLLLIDIKKAH